MARNRRRLRVLVTNDDGIAAPGLRVLVDHLSQIAEVIVVAPASEQSGVGTSITWGRPIRFAKSRQFADIEAYAVEGTPTDCIIVALDLLLKRSPHFVVSGINPGPNVGESDMFLSGTFGAARHASAYGLSSMAISLGNMAGGEYATAASAARTLVQAVSHWKKKGLLLNVNVPDLPLAKIGGVMVTHPYSQRSGSHIRAKKGVEDSAGGYCELAMTNTHIAGEGTDDWAVKWGLVSVTPVGRVWTQSAILELERRVADAWSLRPPGEP